MQRLMSFNSALAACGGDLPDSNSIYGIHRDSWNLILTDPISPIPGRTDCVQIGGFAVPVRYLIDVEVQEEYV